jgi:hypothetical protein
MTSMADLSSEYGGQEIRGIERVRGGMVMKVIVK